MKITIEELKDKYPLFTLKEDGDCVKLYPYSSMSFGFNLDNFSEKLEEELNSKHTDVEQEKTYENKYPNLTIRIHSGKVSFVWRKVRKEDGSCYEGEGISYPKNRCNFNSDDETLNYLNNKMNINEETQFWCTSCSSVQEKTNMGGYLFSGNYCKTCVEGNENLKKELERSKTIGYFT